MKRFRVHLKSKAGDQYVTLLARDRQEAELLATAHQNRRAARYDLTMDRLTLALANGEMTKEQHAAEITRRKKDFSRYDIVGRDGVGSADAPLTIESIKERED